MKKIFVLAGMLIAGSFLLRAQEQEIAKMDSTMTDTAVYNSLFWKIEGNGLKQASYLYGTIHIIPKDSFFLLPAVEEQIQNCDRLVLEISLDINPLSMISSMKQMMLPGGKSIKEYIEPEEYRKLNAFMQDSLATPLPFYQMMKPIFVSQHISTNYCYPAEQQSYEVVLSEEFKKQDKPVSGLETMNDQMKYLDEMPLDVQVDMLLEAIDNPSQGCEMLSSLVSEYRKQNLNRLMELMRQDEDTEEQLDILLDQRNQNWIAKIEDFIANEKVFIAVGAGHLAGPQGVINLLRKEGYVITPQN